MATTATTKQVILQNPFHPLDLSAHDLLTVYKKFQLSRQTNRNPKQQLPIQTIAQLISSLKGCKPSYVQKCMSQALIKDSISWNQFLAFLDQQSQVRYKILDWLLHQKAIVKYRFCNEMPFRSRIMQSYQNITDLSFISMGQDKFMLAAVDHKKQVLINLTDNNFQKIDERIQKNTKQQQQQIQQLQFLNESIIGKQLNQKYASKTVKNKNQAKDKIFSLGNKSMVKSQRLMPITQSQGVFCNSINKNTDQQTYFKKQRRNIHALFNLFSELPFEQSSKVALLASQKIQSRTLNSAYVNQVKQTFQGYATQKKSESRTLIKPQQKPIQIARRKLMSLHQQKSILTYNPYKINRSSKLHRNHLQYNLNTNPKKLNHDRKQKQYIMQSIHQKYCPQINCIAMVYYNLQLCLVKVARQYNKVILQKQDSLKIISENDFKKNEIIQMVEFYYHRTTNKWFILVLFRNQMKNQSKANNNSFVKGYQLNSTEVKWKGDRKYQFAKKKQQFVIDLGRNQIIKLLSQPQYGLHFISHDGKYFTWKQDYISVEEQTIYWKKDFQEKFKNASLSLSCISISSQLNRAVLGTIKGTIIIYDLFSKQYKLKKISSQPVVQIQLREQKAYILCQGEKLILYDILRVQQIQILSVRNEDKLHDKVDRFTLNDEKIVCFGNCIRVYQKFVDQSLQQQKFKMENIYTWRLHKLDRTKGTQNPNLKLIPTFRKQKTSAELLARSQNLFIVVTQIQEAIFYSVSSMTVKFTTILDIPHDQKIMRITVSPDEKLLALVLFTQAIYVFNIFTQELVMFLKSFPYKKYTSISFLDKKNQYLLACGTQAGKIVLIPIVSIPEKQPKTLELHTKPISLLTLRNQLLISASQDQDLALWQLPFNILKYQIKLNGKLPANDHIIQKLGVHQETTYLKTVSGIIIELNTSKGQIKAIYKQFISWNQLSIDVVMGYLIGVSKPGEVSVCEKKDEKQGWVLKKKLQFDSKNQIIGVGIVQSQKVALFAKTGVYVWNYKNEKISKLKSYLQSIV